MRFQFHIYPILFITIILSLFSCDGSRIYEVNKEIDNAEWNRDSIEQFDVEIVDTSLFYNVVINVRNKNDYPYSNLYLFIEMSSPMEKYFTDTLEVQLADNKGKWLGSGIGNIWQNQIRLLSQVKLLEGGTYKIKIGQGMRDDDLIGISDVGVRFEQAR